MNRDNINRGYGGHKPAPQAQTSSAIDSLLDKIVFSKESQNLPTDIFSDIAEKAAEIVSGNKSSNKRTQLRRFYDELAAWNETVQQNKPAAREAKYKDLEPVIKMMKAKIVYAKSRGHVDANFEKLFLRCINSVNSHETLKYCKLFLEAFMGYYRYYRPSDN